jgi:hypothetical protein
LQGSLDAVEIHQPVLEMHMTSKFSSFVGWLIDPPKRRATRTEKLVAKLLLSVCDVALKGAVAVTSASTSSAVAKSGDRQNEATQSASTAKEELLEQRKRFEPPSFGMRFMIKVRQLVIEVALLLLFVIWWKHHYG